jgi:hypothetical protein
MVEEIADKKKSKNSICPDFDKRKPVSKCGKIHLDTGFPPCIYLF